MRYLLRSNIGDWTPISQTMREGEDCESHIHAEPGTWIRWRGGKQPVEDETMVQVEFDSQGDENDTNGMARHFNWAHRSHDYWMNIVAFRVLKAEE